MSNPKITFKLSQYQIARGLQIVRSLEPSFKLTSLSQLVKIIYTDYLAKMSLGYTDDIDQSIIDEVKTFILTPKKRDITLDALIDSEKNLNFNRSNLAMPLPAKQTDSEISTVTDFSPPKDWIDQEI